MKKKNRWIFNKRRSLHTPLILMFLLSFVLFFGSCKKQKAETKEELNLRIQDKVEEKLEARRAERMKACKKAALKIAEVRVDSILLLEAKLTLSDTISKPSKAIKPPAPNLLTPKDSSEIKPLFEEIPDTIE